MAKIVVCLDGTNQVFNQPHPTNVTLIFNALGGAATDAGNGSLETTPPGVQGKYLPGVGSQGNPLLKALGAAFGDGIAEPIVRGYTFLSRSWSPGDEIFIVGFSRGATAARALAGFVVNMGLLDTSRYDPAVKDQGYARAVAAWYLYRQPKHNLIQQARLSIISGLSGEDLPTLGAADFRPPPQVQAVGVFDTVSSLGLPHLDLDGKAQFDFSICDTTLHDRVLNGFHALAADESRDLFSPTFWADRAGVTQRIFPGTHSNVGGGYPERGLSDGALAWMLGELVSVGLPADPARVAPPIRPLAGDVARDDGATFPFKDTPRRPRAFPNSIQPHPSLDARRAVSPGVEMLPDPTIRPYRPVGLYADGEALA